MVFIVGLGNPGRKYEKTRHNLGFRVADRLAVQLGAPPWKTHGQSLVIKGQTGGRPYLLAKPQTFMNHSGMAVKELLAYYKIPLADCLVIVDDLDLALGKVRQRHTGSDGGHLGLRSIIEMVASRDFKRIRIGIGRPPGNGNVISHVLGGSREEETMLEGAMDEAARMAREFLESGNFENLSSN